MLWVRSVCLPMPVAQNGTFMAIVRAYYRTLIVNPPCRISNPLVSVTLWPPEVAETGYRFASFGTIPCYCFQFAHYGITSCCESQPQTHKLRCCDQTQSRKTRCWTLKYSTLLTKRCLILFSRLLNSVVNLWPIKCWYCIYAREETSLCIVIYFYYLYYCVWYVMLYALSTCIDIH